MQRNLHFLPTKATFHLKEQIGVGTVGVVFRATSPDVQGPVAVKLLHPTVSDDRRIVQRFEREVTIMERLDHPHIVRHYGGGMMGGQYFYAMQLLEHGTLRDWLRQYGPLPWPQVAAYGAQIASALQHAHNHGIIHRDLKPGNLFFAEDGRLVLGDFGIALDTHDAQITDHGMTVGTYAYMAPEQIRAGAAVTAKADVYSLGCVLYEMLTGQPAFQGLNFAQIWDQHLHHAPAGIRQQGIACPTWLEQLVLQMLAKHPQDRPFSARAVQGVLRQHLLEEFGDRASLLTNDLPLKRNEPAMSSDAPRVWALWLALAAVIVVLMWAYLAQGR